MLGVVGGRCQASRRRGGVRNRAARSTERQRDCPDQHARDARAALAHSANVAFETALARVDAIPPLPDRRPEVAIFGSQPEMHSGMLSDRSKLHTRSVGRPFRASARKLQSEALFGSD